MANTQAARRTTAAEPATRPRPISFTQCSALLQDGPGFRVGMNEKSRFNTGWAGWLWSGICGEGEDEGQTSLPTAAAVGVRPSSLGVSYGTRRASLFQEFVRQNLGLPLRA